MLATTLGFMKALLDILASLITKLVWGVILFVLIILAMFTGAFIGIINLVT